ncbi:MAG TPA: ATP-dependent DNA helicase UvrD2 [Actinomycetota bacterium]|nr:ATP-dependent DNA helicase UvrD2 [Actinomycetota bacterium]
MSQRIFDGLDPEQLSAVRAIRGPVCILAGAGSGKTTTITQRIANQVASGAFEPGQILAVTFTDKAAKEMASRLATLGAGAVRARTFHAEALAQYRQLSSEEFEILGSKVQVLKSLVQSLPMPHRFTAVRDIATEVEWAKNQLITPVDYLDRLGPHTPPIPPELMATVFERYEKRKASAKLIDFEDLLARAVEVLQEPAAVRQIRDRYLAFTVDEYQDVNLLQQSLLDAWVGDRRDICVVGDDYQSIYSFTGASASHLLGFKQRYPDAKVLLLTSNYRSTPQILDVSNRLVPKMLGSSKLLRPTRGPSQTPAIQGFASAEDEIAHVISSIKRLVTEGIALEEIAILYRINARSEPFEEALSEARIAYQVADSPFLRRPGPRAALQRLRRIGSADVAASVEDVVHSLGYQADALGADGDEATRQADLGRLVAMAREFSAGGVQEFVADLVARFTAESDGRGVQLLTYHRAKGKEYEAVFLPRLEDGELPFSLSRTDDQIAEERRLFYVGITRAKTHLSISWTSWREAERRSRPSPSPFLSELGATPMEYRKPRLQPMKPSVPESDLFLALKRWRSEVAREKNVPAYIVFQDATLTSIAEAKPTTPRGLLQVKGVGPAKCEEYSAAIIELVQADGTRH